MRFHRKNKGFTLIELMVVIAVTIILLGIILGNTGEQRQKAIVEEKAGAIRDFLVEVGAVASKTQTNIIVSYLDNGKLVAIYENLFSQNATAVEMENQSRNTNFEGGKAKFVVLNDNIDSFGFGESTGLTNRLEFNEENKNYKRPDGLKFNNNIHVVTITPQGACYATAKDNIPYYKITKGYYSAIIEIRGKGNINIYTCHNKKGSPADEEFYQTK